MSSFYQKTLNIERGKNNQGMQIIRIVVDCLQYCNLRCKYCHPGKTWEKIILSAEKIEEIFRIGEEKGVLEITLTGGEPTLHPEFHEILKATHILNRTVTTLITNATRITPGLVELLRDSNISRICVSLDGADAATHNSARGETFERVLQGLKDLQKVSKPITVLTVAHQGNWRKVLKISEMLAKNHWATQHHINAPCYSGEAKKNYTKLMLTISDFFALQNQIDVRFREFLDKGLYVTFNSFWPATGRRSRVSIPRNLTLSQLAEQLKDCYIIVRPNGDVRLTAATWGRETVGNAVVGNLKRESFRLLFNKAEGVYRKGQAYQLPRDEETKHKFQIGVNSNRSQTDKLLSGRKQILKMAKMIPLRRLSELDIFKQKLMIGTIKKMALNVIKEPLRYRIVKNSSGAFILFDRVTTHVTLLKEVEIKQMEEILKEICLNRV